jgi:hypothetical protein
MRISCLSVGMVTLALLSGSASAGLINIDFKSAANTPSYTGAGVIGSAGQYWNSYVAGSGWVNNNVFVLSALSDSTGATVAVRTAVATGTAGTALARQRDRARRATGTAGTTIAAIAAGATRTTGTAATVEDPRAAARTTDTAVAAPGVARTTDTTGTADARHRQESGFATSATSTTRGADRDRYRTRSAVAATAQEQAAMATRTAGATINPRTTFTAVAEPARSPAIAAVKAISGITDQTGIAAVARRITGAGSCGPGVAVAQQDARIRVLRCAATDEEPQDAARGPPADRRRARQHRTGRRCARERIH